MTSIYEAVILMAGEGSRLRASNNTFLKPFVPVLGRPLICYTLDSLAHAGIQTINFVVGYEMQRVISQIKELTGSAIEARFIENREWQKQNGISLLTAANHVDGPFLLTMCDHLFDSAIIKLLIGSADYHVLNTAVDRKLDSIFDLHDAMKVRTRGNQVTAIGKNLGDYDAIDTGLFICPLEFFDYLERARSASLENDCSLADGVRLMAVDKKVRAIDIGDAWWQDVDTPEMLQYAEKQMAEKMQSVMT